MSQYREAQLHHYARTWNADPEIVPFSKGPISDLPPDFTVVRFAPHANRKLWTYATVCMSQTTDADPLELHMFSQTSADELVELLFAVAHYHRTGASLRLHHSVNFGRPWLPGSLCDRGLISLPYLDGLKLERMQFGSKQAKFLWLIPITTIELEYRRINGTDALERRFEDSQFDYSDPYRASVA